jgi:hypothetical protein
MLSLCLQAVSQDKQEITSSDYSNQSVDMADTFRQEGKIYVVVGVILTILAGFFIYLILIDRKLGKLEKHSDISRD